MVGKAPRLSLALSLALAAGCKADDGGSGLQSLDNLGSTEEKINACSGPYAAANRPTLRAARTGGRLRLPAALTAGGEPGPAVETAFSALPPAIAKELFQVAEVAYVPRAQLGGRSFKVTDGVAGEGEQKVATLKLELDESPQAVGHATVLAAMGVVLNRIAYLGHDGGVTVVKASKDEDMRQFQRSLVVHYVHDAMTGGKYGLERLRALLPTAPAFYAKETPVEARAQIWDAFAKAQPKKADEAQDQVFWNAADSYYCSDATRATMASDFPNVGALMKEDFDSVIADATTAKASDQGISLWGRWGFGNGPLRQFFSNRIDQTGYVFPRLHGFFRPLDGSYSWNHVDGSSTPSLFDMGGGGYSESW